MRLTSPAALLLAAWLGAGILFAAVVAPAAFAVLPSQSPMPAGHIGATHMPPLHT